MQVSTITIGRGVTDPSKLMRRVWDLKDDEVASLATLLASPPNEAGLTGSRWTAALVVQLLASQFQVRATRRSVGKSLRKRGVAAPPLSSKMRRLKPDQVSWLCVALTSPPSHFGFAADNWSRELIANLVRTKFNLSVTGKYATRLIRPAALGITLERKQRRLNSKQAAALKRHLLQSPRLLGFDRETWTHDLVAQTIDRLFHVTYNRYSVRMLLKRWDICVPVASQRRICLTSAQVAQLARALRHSPKESLLSGNVWTQRLIAHYIKSTFGISYKKGSIAGLLRRAKIEVLYRAQPGGGSPVNDLQLRQLHLALMQHPSKVGVKAKHWTHESIAFYVRNAFGVDYSVASVPKLLVRLQALDC